MSRKKAKVAAITQNVTKKTINGPFIQLDTLYDVAL
jgi:hypothetical protein